MTFIWLSRYGSRIGLAGYSKVVNTLHSFPCLQFLVLIQMQHISEQVLLSGRWLSNPKKNNKPQSLCTLLLYYYSIACTNLYLTPWPLNCRFRVSKRSRVYDSSFLIQLSHYGKQNQVDTAKWSEGMTFCTHVLWSYLNIFRHMDIFALTFFGYN